MEYIRYVLYRNRFRIAAFAIILMLAVLGVMYQGNKQSSNLGKSYLIEEYNESQYNKNNQGRLFFDQYKDVNDKLNKDEKNKPIVISELSRPLKDRRIINVLIALTISVMVSFFIFLVIPILLRNTYVNKRNLKHRIGIPFLTYFNSNFKKDKKAERKKEKAKEAKEEQLGELVAKVFANKMIKDKKELLFISDDIREDKIDIVFELATMLSNLDKKILILDLPLEVKKEIEKVEKKERKAQKKEQINKLTTFSDKLFAKFEEERQSGIKIYSCLDKNVTYAAFDNDKEKVKKMLLTKSEILEREYLDSFDYVLVNGIDTLEAERYVALANNFPNIILLTKHFKTETEKIEEIKYNIDNTNAIITGIIIVKKEKYNN